MKSSRYNIPLALGRHWVVFNGLSGQATEVVGAELGAHKSEEVALSHQIFALGK